MLAIQTVASLILPNRSLQTERPMATVALGLGIYGAVNASIALIDKIGSSSVDLKERWEDVRKVPQELDELVRLSDQLGKIAEKIKAELESYPQNDREAIPSGVIEVFQGKLHQKVEEATTALESLDKYRGWNRLCMAARKKSIFGVMSKVQSCLEEALDAASNIETHLRPEAVWPPQTKEEEFTPLVDCTELPDNVFLDFRSDDTCDDYAEPAVLLQLITVYLSYYST